jgi:hypothetical protein
LGVEEGIVLDLRLIFLDLDRIDVDDSVGFLYKCMLGERKAWRRMCL